MNNYHKRKREKSNSPETDPFKKSHLVLRSPENQSELVIRSSVNKSPETQQVEKVEKDLIKKIEIEEIKNMFERMHK